MDPSQIPPDVPLVSPPPGQTSDFAHKVNQHLHVQIVVTLIICVMLSTTSVGLRVATRCWIVKLFGWDDGLAVLAMLLNFGLTVCFAGLLGSGLDYSNYNTSLRDFMENDFSAWTFWNALFTVFLYFTFAAIKLSVLMLYIRLLSPAHNYLRFSVWMLVVFNIAVLIGTTTGLLEFCHPALKLFKPEIPGTCDVSAVLFVVQGVLSVVTDLMILIPPIIVVWRINAPKTRRFGFVASLCTGLFVTGIGFARLGILVGELTTTNLTFDIQYLGTYLAIFEINFGLIAICLPALRQFFLKIQDLYIAYRHPSSMSRSGDWAIEDQQRSPTLPNSLLPSFNKRYSDGTYTELGDNLNSAGGRAPKIMIRTASEQDEYNRLGLRRDDGRIGNGLMN